MHEVGQLSHVIPSPSHEPPKLVQFVSVITSQPELTQQPPVDSAQFVLISLLSMTQ